MRLVFVVLLLAANTAWAQSWPSKPLRYIVPFPPGAFNDTLARTLSAELPKTLGQPVVVDNRPGGNTIIGTELAAKSAPDGYTLFGAALPFSVVQSLYKTSFDVTRDFAPITLAGVTPNLLVANVGMPFNDVKGLIAHAKASMGHKTEALEILAQLATAMKTRYVSGYSFAVIYLALGEKDQALDWLEKDAREQTGFEINFIKVDPYLDSLRGDPRFEALAAKVLSGSVK